MASFYPTACLVAAYLLLVIAILPRFMAKRKRFEFKHLLLGYNVVSIVLNLFIIHKIWAAKTSDLALCTTIQAGDYESLRYQQVGSRGLLCITFAVILYRF
jgi:hypothetical protein